MSYTYTPHVGDGSTKVFPFSFAGQDEGYLRETDVVVTVDGVEVPFSINISDPNRVYLTTAPANGAPILIRRIMPKDVPYSDFSRGNPFNQDSLNNSFLQMLYLLQEIYDGYLPAGFYFRVPIDMRGQRILNLGDGIDEGDTVNKGQLDVESKRNDVQDGRLNSLDEAIKLSPDVKFIAQQYKAVGGETTIHIDGGFLVAALYLNGALQFKLNGAYTQSGDTVTLAEPLTPGDVVYMLLGVDAPIDVVYVSIYDFLKYQEKIAQQFQDLPTTLDDLYAKRGANDDITSISGLQTALSIEQGGTGAKTVATAQSALDIFTRTGVTSGAAAAAGKVGQVLTNTTLGTSLVSGVLNNAVQLTLTPGEWEVSGSIQLNPSSAQVYLLIDGISTTTKTDPGFPYKEQFQMSDGTTAPATQCRQLPRRLMRVSTNTVIYAVVSASFPSGTLTVDGYLEARRVR